MKRREFITLLGGAVGGLAARGPRTAANNASDWLSVRWFARGRAQISRRRSEKELRETGYIEGQNVAIEYRWADNVLDRLPELAADLVRR